MGWQDAPLVADGTDSAGQGAPAPVAANDRSPSSGAKPAAWEQAPLDKTPAPITDSGTHMGFADEAPVEATRQLSPDDEATFYKMLRGDGVPRATADELRQFVASKGLALQDADAIVDARDKGLGVTGTISYPLAKPTDPSSVHGATLRGATQGATMGFGDELHGVAAGAKAALDGGSFTDAYDRTVDADRGRLAADEEQHPYATIAGQLLGGLIVPAGLEKAGLTASVEAVGLAAGKAALREGATMADARIVAQRAITRRFATEGAAYGGAYGAGSSNGGPGERLLGAGAGALEGAGLGAGMGLIGEKVAPALYDARVSARGAPAEPLSDAAQVGQAAARQGISILPQDVGGPGIARATQGAAQTPFGTSTIARAANRLYDSFRDRVGDMLSDPNLTEKIAPRQLRALYGALTTDMEATAREAGPQAYGRWKRANDFYDGRMKRINDTFSLVLGPKGDATPNEAFSAVQSMLKPGASGNAAAFSRIMRSLSPEDANSVRASIVNDARGGRTFDADRFAKTWGQLSERGKSALLPQTGMRSLMDDAADRAAINSRNPFAGKSGEQVFSALEAMAGNKGDATRFGATMNRLSPEEATAVRSTFIDRLGRATPGQQNADGDAFSIGRWLTNWNKLTPRAQTALFGTGELRAAMKDLATIAEKVKGSERLAGHSNTGAVHGFDKTTGGLYGAVAALFTGHVPLAAALAAPAAYQRISAEMLTSPRLLRWLTRVPAKASYDGQRAYLSKLTTIAAREPAIASNVVHLQDYLRGALNSVPGRAAAGENVGDSRQAPPNRQNQANGQQ